MSRYANQYVSTCNLCLQTKLICQLPLGELKLLAVSNTRWNIISVDFVVELLMLQLRDLRAD